MILALVWAFKCITTVSDLKVSFSSQSRVTSTRAHILVQVTIYRRLRIGRDGHLDQSEAYDIL